MKKLLLLTILLGVLFVFNGCGSETTKETIDTDKSTSEVNVNKENMKDIEEVSIAESQSISILSVEQKPVANMPEAKPIAPENNEELIQSIRKAFAVAGCNS